MNKSYKYAIKIYREAFRAKKEKQDWIAITLFLECLALYKQLPASKRKNRRVAEIKRQITLIAINL